MTTALEELGSLHAPRIRRRRGVCRLPKSANIVPTRTIGKDETVGLVTRYGTPRQKARQTVPAPETPAATPPLRSF